MSYSAYVNCSCFKKGKTVAPPFKELVRQDREGIYLDIPNEMYEQEEKKASRMYSKFRKWKQTACEHDDMELAYEFLTNNVGMNNFRFMIDKLGGKDKFPILTKYLPTANGGTLPAKHAKQALEELLILERKRTTNEQELLFEDLVILREKSTGDRRASTNVEDIFIFAFFGGDDNFHFRYAINKDGFLILKYEKKRNKKEVSYIEFQSKNFIQRKLSKTSYKFIDIESGKSVEYPVNIYPTESKAKEKKEYEFVITNERMPIDTEYAYLIEPLKKLVNLSIQSKNPIIWT